MPPDIASRCLQEPAKELTKGHPEPYARLRADALSILDAALQAVMPDRLLSEALSEDGRLTVDGVTYELGDGQGVHVLCAGKASQGFAQVAHQALPEARGLVIDHHEGEAGDWRWLTGEHPLPGEGSLAAGQAALELARSVPEDELLLVFLSGGASALMEVPAVPIEDLSMATNTMLARGVTVREMNTVRKHLSKLKGGQLAEACPGRVVTVAICDVPHQRATDVGSGPTVPDPTTFEQAFSILDRVGTDNFPPVVVDHIQAGVDGNVPETPGPETLGQGREAPAFHFLATNRTALEAGEARARELGYQPSVLPSPLEGEARVQGASLARRLASEGHALLAGGETVVSLRPDHQGGPGLGGRNQELTLAAALELQDAPAVVCGFGTDGIDGPTDAAGAIADGRSLARGLEAKRDAQAHLEKNDAYTFFAALGDLIRTGPSGTNVMDLVVGLVAPEGLVTPQD